MDTISMNSENSRTSEHHVFLLKIVDKLDLRKGKKSVALSNLSIIINLKYLLEHGVINLNYQMDHIQYQIFKIVLSIFLKNIVKVLMTDQSKSL